MESLSKKSPAGMSGISFASAAAGKGSAASSTAAPAVAAAASTAGTPTAGGSSGPTAKNGSNASSRQSSPALGSQSPALGADKESSVSQAGASGTIDWVLGKHVKVVTLADEVYEGQVYAFDVIMNCVCPSKLVSASPTPAAYYSPSLGGNSPASRQKYDFRILKINYIKEVSPIQDAEAVSTSTAKAGEDLAATMSTSAKSNEGSAVSSPNPASTSTTAATAATKESGDVKETKEGSERNTTTSGGGSNVTNNIYSSVLPAVGFVHLDRIRQREQQAVREAQAAAARIGVGVSTAGQEIFDALSKTLPCRWAKDSIVVMDEVIIAPPYEPENCKANASSSYTLARVKKVLEGERSRMANGRK